MLKSQALCVGNIYNEYALIPLGGFGLIFHYSKFDGLLGEIHSKWKYSSSGHHSELPMETEISEGQGIVSHSLLWISAPNPVWGGNRIIHSYLSSVLKVLIIHERWGKMEPTEHCLSCLWLYPHLHLTVPVLPLSCQTSYCSALKSQEGHPLSKLLWCHHLIPIVH